MRKHGFDQAPWANPHTIPLKPPYPVFHTVYLLFHLLLTNCIFCAVSWMPGFGGPFFLSHVLLENLLKLNLSRSSNPGFAIISPFSIFPKKLQTACLQNGAPLLTGIGVACRRKEAHKHRSWSGPSSHHSKHFRWRDSRVWRVIFWSCRHPVYFIFLSSLSCSSGTDFSAAVFIYGGVKPLSQWRLCRAFGSLCKRHLLLMLMMSTMLRMVVIVMWVPHALDIIQNLQKNQPMLGLSIVDFPVHRVRQLCKPGARVKARLG